ncbi:transporter [Desulfomicrobium sp. ZS1]|uniref:SphA family protein n=1 Tax=Desulfomicrobium sp. ZS1 TaxID=2952228 RepID=UPI0020B19EC9|nr:transporter [Desulfomicrobium sp. ZS1]UTF50508.1 transporter [Desulfomicrobium sp. ZS1]
MKKLIHVVMVAVFLMASASAYAGSGHYVNGAEGIKAATLPPEGVYWRVYNLFYTADELKDKNGKDVDLDFDVNVYALVNRLVYSSGIQFLGGNIVADICVPLVYTDISLQGAGPYSFSDNEFGLGDILIEPLLLAWHGPRYDAAVGVGAYMPTGDFDADEPASPGKGFWTGMFTAGATFYFDEQRTWSASILSRYEIHSEQEDTDWTPGNDFHFEWGLGKTLDKIWDVGLAGYCRWQVTDDSGSGSVDDREEAYAIGPEVSVFMPNYGLGVSLRSLWEFENKLGSQGNVTTLMIMKAF